ncbi:MAG: hypothetical protein IT169_20045 [Bryobacterales bacterium]|nr:hypothetical protein [Bryobacterales bacterium]
MEAVIVAFMSCLHNLEFSGTRRRRRCLRLSLCLALAALAAGLLLSCTPPKVTLTLPAQVGAWQRSAETPIDPASFPDVLRRLDAVRGVRASYSNASSSVQATVYEMPSPTSAFEAVQTYPRHAGEFYFQKGASFVVLGLAELAAEGRRPFLLDFQKATVPDGPEAKQN